MADNEDHLDIDPSAAILTPDDLPQEERNPWVSSNKESGTKNYQGTRDYAERLLEVKNSEDVQFVAGSWRYLRVELQVFEELEDAKEEYNDEDEALTEFGDFSTSSPGFGDISISATPNTGADDVHLVFRENNLVARIVESGGNKGQEEVLDAAAEVQAARIESRLQ